MKTNILLTIFLVALALFAGCDSLWDVKETTDISFSISKSALEELFASDSMQQVSNPPNGGNNSILRSIDFDDDGIEMTFSLHNAGDDSVLTSKTLVVKEDESVRFDKLAIVGKRVYAKAVVKQNGMTKEGRSETKTMVEGENSLNIATLRTVVYKIGDTGPGGGIIFYANSTTGEHKEVSENLGEYNWYQASGTPHATNNSQNLSIAKDYRDGVFTDWYLPDQDELNKVYLNAKVPGYIDETSVLWSSSENTINDAWYQNFNSGNQNYYLKTYTYGVRAIRAFNTSSL